MKKNKDIHLSMLIETNEEEIDNKSGDIILLQRIFDRF